MNFIFDIGNVLIDFKPDIFVKKLFTEQIIAEKILATIFGAPEWLKMDQGLLTHPEAIDIFSAREPGYQAEIRHTMERVTDMLIPMIETVELLPRIKTSGHSLYYLSNYHKELSEYILGKYDFFDLFDGGVFSCDIRVNKPSPEIYRFLLEKYMLPASDCVFFDDMTENVLAAEKEGIKGILFTGAECVKRFLT